MPRDDVHLVFLTDLSPDERGGLTDELRGLGLAEDQLGFSRPAAEVLAAGQADRSRDTFAVLLADVGRRQAVGIGVLQPYPPEAAAQECREVTFRGFSIDPRWQGQGIGGRATALALAAAVQRFGSAERVRLTVHVDNIPGQRAYARCGFERVGEPIPGRAGWEHLMTRELRG